MEVPIGMNGLRVDSHTYAELHGNTASGLRRTDLRKDVSGVTGQAFEELDQRGEALQQHTVRDVQRAQLQE